MTATLIGLVVAVVFIGALMRGTFGFGEAVISMPLLTLLPINLHTAISLVGLMGLTATGPTIISGWRHIDHRTLIWLLGAALPGIPVGLALVTFAPASLVTRTLGILLILYGGYSLLRPMLDQTAERVGMTHRGWALPFGFASGMLGSAYNIGGIPIVVYGTLSRWNRTSFHGTLQAYFLFADILIVSGQGLGGLWTANLFTLYAFSLPAIIVATLLGLFLHRRIPTERFTRYVFIIIILFGLLSLVTSA
ncbi:UPF0721 transmembrane protein [Reticulibacter mediterranei]|uniref:Probable membrane transporter protein n=1 Tax=Reticulibacter mediterranei TaxID=2778369 RepID=A0A8J3ISD6_9CHLR|nr:sulfite exporter TauE/SafE family protein [Reticulibacter mediterranei]GHO97738.1 UPF0721 transmembrane protein [Reticulibacter mediterranei]